MECHCHFYHRFSVGCLWGFRSVCCQAEVGIFNHFHVCASQFPALTLQNMVYLCCSEQLRAVGAKALLSRGKLMWRKAGNGGAQWLCCSWGEFAFGSALLVFLREGERKQRSSFRNVSGLRDASPISKAAALVAAGGWWLGDEAIKCDHELFSF